MASCFFYELESPHAGQRIFSTGVGTPETLKNSIDTGPGDGSIVKLVEMTNKFY
jgi:hypothetical protein